MIRRIAPVIAAAFLTCTSPVLAWGGKGHTIINHLAAQNLPADLPPFMHTPDAVFELTTLGPEEDNLKGSGRAWDGEFDPGHFVDLDDDGTVAGAVQLNALPDTREAYDTALRGAKSNQYRAGYLPYALLEGWQQIRDDFAYWRVFDYRAMHAATADARAEAARDRDLRAALTLHDIGVWGHFVGDACQPLHTTVHFNGWGNYPNPNNYSTARNTHSMFESEFVDKFVNEGDVAKMVVATTPLPVSETTAVTQDQIKTAIAKYLDATSATVTHLYDIDKAGGFTGGSPDAVRFTESRLAAGAMEERDLVEWAWQDSLNSRVGYPSQPVRDVLAGKTPPKRDGDAMDGGRR